MKTDFDRTIMVTGHGTARGIPDLARVTFGVEMIHADLAPAYEATAAAMSRLIVSLLNIGIARADIQTRNLAVNSRNERVDHAEREYRQVYAASQSITVTIRDISAVSRVLSTAVRKGANKVESLHFEAANPEALIAQARLAAVADAQEHAKQLADALHVSVGRPLKVAEGKGESRSIHLRESFLNSDRVMRDMPVEAGLTAIHYHVRVTFSLQ